MEFKIKIVFYQEYLKGGSFGCAAVVGGETCNAKTQNNN
jgi:hypothetical protein